MSHPCDICGSVFNYESILKLHYRSHTREKPFQCVFCPSSFSYEAHLIVHRQIHVRREPYICDLCNNSFLDKSNLEHHYKLHKNERRYKADRNMLPSVHGSNSNCTASKQASKICSPGQKPHVCDICNSKFHEKSELEQHYKLEEDEKKYEKGRKVFTSENGSNPCATSTQDSKICNRKYSKKFDKN